MKKPISADLLKKYLEEKCNPEEAAQVKEWYDSFQEEYDGISDMGGSEETSLERALYLRILNRLQNDNNSPADSKFFNLRIIYPLAGIAALLLITLSIFILPKYGAFVQNKNRLVNSERIHITNSTKTIFKVVLPDSSYVWLNPGAEVSYLKNLNQMPARLVNMSGECFFQVTKDPHKPFLVTSNLFVTKVLGTSFRIRETGDAFAEVSVLTGKVTVQVKGEEQNVEKQEQVLLLPDQKVTYRQKQNLLKREKEDVHSSVNIWKRINLNFDNIPLKTIIPVLNSSYNTTISVENKELDNYMLTADFEGFNLPEVLETLKKSLNISYEVTDDNIILLK